MKKPLTSTERAMLQLAESIVISACIAGLLSIEPLIAGSGPVDWKVVLTSFGLAVAFSVAHSVAAYFKPSQPDLSAALDAIIAELEARNKPVQNAPQKPVAQPQAVARPNVPPAIQQAPTPVSVPNPSLVWTPLQGMDVSSIQTAPQPAQPPQQ